MSKAAKKRHFLRWKRYRRHCEQVARQRMPLTMAMSKAWSQTMYPVQGGKFYTMPPW